MSEMNPKFRPPESRGGDVVHVNCVKTVRMQPKHEVADISSLDALPGDPYRMKIFHESQGIELRVAEVTRLREGNLEAHKVEEHVKRVVDDMEVKQLKNKGRKRQRNKQQKPSRFAITGLISGKNVDLLKFLFRKFSVGEDRWSEEIARYDEFAVTRVDFQCLSPATPLNCKVINICAAYLNEKDFDCWFLPTFFGERARCNQEPSSHSHRYWLECTISMCGLKRFHRRLHMCSKIFIPLRDNIDDHWFLLVINLDNQTAILWDSLPDANSVARRMHHARDLFISEEHRNRIALEIIRDPRNEHGRDVIAAAGRQNNIQDNIPHNPDQGNLSNPPTGRKFRSHRKRRDRT